jgi:hypothetical protein
MDKNCEDGKKFLVTSQKHFDEIQEREEPSNSLSPGKKDCFIALTKLAKKVFTNVEYGSKNRSSFYSK